MSSLLDRLESTQILYSQNVTDIKNCIHRNYPSVTSQYAAELFSKAVHQILSQSLYPFSNAYKETLKHELLKIGVQKSSFSLNGYDLFKACRTSSIPEDQYVPSLRIWVQEELKEQLPEKDILTALDAISKGVHPDAADAKPLSVPEKTLNVDTVSSWTGPLLLQPLTQLITTLKQVVTAHKNLIAGFMASCLIVSVCIVYYSNYLTYTQTASKAAFALYEFPMDALEKTSKKAILISEAEYLEPELQYKEINREALKAWLENRNSILAEEPYFSHIIHSAESYNINPLLMFAITGQEQGFVPRTHEKAKTIANNPFNVYGSWIDFNTDIKDTSQIAARTIITLSQNCPENEDPIKWLNKKYAEDPNWHLGVSSILTQLEDVAGTP